MIKLTRFCTVLILCEFSLRKVKKTEKKLGVRFYILNKSIYSEICRNNILLKMS